jgi:hypothetical protein
VSLTASELENARITTAFMFCSMVFSGGVIDESSVRIAPRPHNGAAVDTVSWISG